MTHSEPCLVSSMSWLWLLLPFSYRKPISVSHLLLGRLLFMNTPSSQSMEGSFLRVSSIHHEAKECHHLLHAFAFHLPTKRCRFFKIMKKSRGCSSTL
ncbi:hypothetical protein V8C42DRAFT_312701 [Trichoderma barbatum]